MLRVTRGRRSGAAPGPGGIGEAMPCRCRGWWAGGHPRGPEAARTRGGVGAISAWKGGRSRRPTCWRGAGRSGPRAGQLEADRPGHLRPGAGALSGRRQGMPPTRCRCQDARGHPPREPAPGQPSPRRRCRCRCRETPAQCQLRVAEGRLPGPGARPPAAARSPVPEEPQPREAPLAEAPRRPVRLGAGVALGAAGRGGGRLGAAAPGLGAAVPRLHRP